VAVIVVIVVIVPTKDQNEEYQMIVRGLKRLGCISKDPDIKCIECDKRTEIPKGANALFSSDEGVTLCCDRLKDILPSRVREIVCHELIHAYDFCRVCITS